MESGNGSGACSLFWEGRGEERRGWVGWDAGRWRGGKGSSSSRVARSPRRDRLRRWKFFLGISQCTWTEQKNPRQTIFLGLLEAFDEIVARARFPLQTALSTRARTTMSRMSLRRKVKQESSRAARVEQVETGGIM